MNRRILLLIIVLSSPLSASLRERVEKMEVDIFSRIDKATANISDVKEATQELTEEFKKQAQQLDELLIPVIHDQVKKLKEALEVKRSRENHLAETNAQIEVLLKFLSSMKEKTKELYPDLTI